MPTTLIWLLFCATLAAADFDPAIRTLLRGQCVECHGAEKQKGGLRLDARSFALKGGTDGPVIAPGKADASALFLRITSTDPDVRMPPEGPGLTAAEIGTLKAWIDEGAVWPENDADRAAAVDKRRHHWAVQPLRRPADLAAELGVRPEQLSIDAFIQRTLADHQLEPSPEADRRTLARRLWFDLHGLPPDPEDVARFISDPDPSATARLVEQLLASPHYGERWARHWLDIAHYADTHGFERDQLRPNAWRYRDYVIAAFNADKPYDVFLREQIAGDVMAPDDPEKIVATGFLAAGPWDFVGQVETRSEMLRRAARAGDLDDMVTQVITATMGLTVNCARCHDHKLDPISQREYYSLWSIFAGVRRGEREVDPAASRRLATEKRSLGADLARKRAELATLSGDGIHLARLLPEGSGIDLRDGTVTKERKGYQRDIKANQPTPVPSIPAIRAVFVPNGPSPVPRTTGHAWDTIANRPLNGQRSSTLGGIDYTTPGHSMLAMHANSGLTFDLAQLRSQSGFTAMRLTATLGFGAGAEAAATLAGFTVLVDSDLKFQRLDLRKSDTVTLEIPIAESARDLTLIATDGGDGLNSDLLFLGDLSLEPGTPPRPPSSSEAAALAARREEIRQLESRIAKLPEPEKVYAIVPEAQPPVIRVQRRGNPEDETDAVLPGALSWPGHAPAALGDASMPESARRLALANWVTHPDNPLTARVIVNRLWHHHFGRGLVNTPSDFGLGGDRPSHPALLDYLAGELIRGGWQLKAIHRLILSSATYRQSSTTPSAPARSDESNRLLWRQNPRRLDAESLRDAVLSVSGKLNPERGGPGFRDFNYTEAYAPVYEYITPDAPELWKRSIYRFVVRTTPHRFMTTLDCPDPANLSPTRNQTTTALQALVLSNNEFMLRQADHFASRVASATPRTPERIERAFQLVFQRPPTAEESAAAQSLVETQGLFSLCRMLLNANEFVYLD